MSDGRMGHEACITLDDPSGWNRALDGVRHGFAHTWENAYAMRLTTGYPTYLYVYTSGETRIVCPVAERTFSGYVDIVTPYGLSGFVSNGTCPEFGHHWRQFARTRGYVCGYFAIHPLLMDESLYPVHELEEQNEIYVIDLRRSLDELFARLSTNRRRVVRDMDKSMRIVQNRERLADFFLRHYHEFMSAKGASSVYQFSPQTLSFLTGLENVFMFGAANEDDRLESVSMFACTRDVATYLFNVSIPEGRRHAAPLLWCGIEHARSLDIHWMDLGGGIRKNDSLAEFKRRFGGDAKPLKALKQIYDTPVFESLCREVNVDAARSGYFPPYRRP